MLDINGRIFKTRLTLSEETFPIEEFELGFAVGHPLASRLGSKFVYFGVYFSQNKHEFFNAIVKVDMWRET